MPAIVITRSDIGPVSRLETFDIRNGELKDAVSLITKAAVPPVYRWIPIAGLPHTDAVAYTDMFIRCAFAALRNSTPNNMTPDQVRKVAITLGTARAAMTELYALEETDLIPGETVAWMLRYVPPVAPATVPTWESAPGLDAAVVTILGADMGFTDEERGVISDLMLCAAAIPPLHGLTLMNTGHHYLSEVKEKSRAAYLCVETQLWKKEPTKSWTDTDKALIQDALWHKAGHPVNMRIKYKTATDPAIGEKLRVAGCGGASSRLPAREADLKAAETCRTLMMAVRPFFEAYGGALNCEVLEKAIEMVKIFVPKALLADGPQGTIGNVDPKMVAGKFTPAWVVDRESALVDLKDVLSRNQDTIAIAFGFFESLCESTTMGGGDDSHQSLLGSNHLKKVKGNAFASYAMGREAHGDYKAFKAAQRQNAKYTPVKQAII